MMTDERVLGTFGEIPGIGMDLQISVDEETLSDTPGIGMGLGISVDEETLNKIMVATEKINAETLPATNVASPQKTKTVHRQQKTVEQIDQQIAMTEKAIEDYEKLIIVSKAKKPFEYDKYNKAVESARIKSNKQALDLLLSSNTKNSLNTIIKIKLEEISVLQNEITLLQERISKGDYDESKEEEIIQLATINAEFERYKKSKHTDHVEWVENHIKRVVYGMKPNGEKTNTPGAIEKIEIGKKLIESLKKDRENLINEKSKSVDEMEMELMGTNKETQDDLQALFDQMDENDDLINDREK